MTSQRLLSVKDAAARLDRSQEFVYRQVYAGRIAYRKIGARIMFLEEDLAAWLAASRVAPAHSQLPASPPPRPIAEESPFASSGRYRH